MERMKNNMVLRDITLADLWNIFVRRFWIMLLAVVVSVGGMFVYVQATFVPRYESTATLYILNQDNDDSVSSTYNSFTLALKVVNDCTYLLKSHTVLDTVIDDLDLDIQYDDLYDCISTANPEDTRILEVTVESDMPEKAKEIVDAICEIGSEQINNAMGFNQVNLYEYGVLNENPNNITGIFSYMLLGIIAAVCVYAVFLINFVLDDRIRSEEDVQRYLGLAILGEMPNADAGSKKGYGYYRSGKYKYGYGYDRDPYASKTKSISNGSVAEETISKEGGRNEKNGKRASVKSGKEKRN